MNSSRFVRKSLMLALLVGMIMAAQAQTAAQQQTAAATVSGPPLWKVSKGDHSLWIFAMLTPLEAGVNWRSKQVESIIESAEEYLYFQNPEPKIPVNPFKLINGLRLVMKIRNNPEGKTLQEVIPADLYSRFAPLAELYQIPDVDNARPYYAADSLRGYAVIANQLTEDHGVGIKIEGLVRSNASITRTPINLGPEYLDYDFVKDFAQRLSEAASIDDEIHCLELSVTSVEADITGMRLRAQAWAEGNVGVLRRNRDVIDAAGVCGQVLLGNRVDEANARWLRAAETALNNNVTIFAVLELDQLIDTNGLLEKLRARGYAIDEPGAIGVSDEAR